MSLQVNLNISSNVQNTILSSNFNKLQASKILILEDNTDVAFSIVKYLSRQGYDVDYFNTPQELFNNKNLNQYDCYLIDINLPEKSGYEVIQYLRTANTQSPVIAITARDSIQDKLQAFELGCTDYVVKPFDLQELEARIRTHLRKITPQHKTELIINQFRIDDESHTACYDGKKLKLTNIEFRILYLLIQKANLVVNTDDIIEYAWGDEPDVINPPIRMHISKLRKKINDENYTIIETIPGIGFKLNA